MGLQPDSTFGCKLCCVRLQPGCMHGVAGGTCRPTARASSSTRARCSCWASGATARIRRRSGRARSCDSSSGGSTWPQARAMPVWLFLALGGRIAAFGHATFGASKPRPPQVLQLRSTCYLLLFAGLSYLAVPASRAALLASVQGSEAARRSSGGVVLPLRIRSYGRSATTI